MYQFEIILKDGWKHRNHENLKFLWYEDIISDLPKIIKEIATFTEKEVLCIPFSMANRHVMCAFCKDIPNGRFG